MSSRSLMQVLSLLAIGWAGLDLVARLTGLRSAVPGRLVLTTSFGAEDQVLTHVIAENSLDIEMATLDTGRLFPETYDVWAETERRYGLRIASFHPDREALTELVARQGINGFRETVAARQACCAVRKVEPLRRALLDAEGWITGLRAEQSTQRQDVPFVLFDETYRLIKANPLRDWTRADVTAFLDRYEVPRNALHARGYLSIGCAPCTRAIAPGEAERAGRWWWEQEGAKECGLHLSEDGRLIRARQDALA